jgi:hypothetical protein
MYGKAVLDAPSNTVNTLYHALSVEINNRMVLLSFKYWKELALSFLSASVKGSMSPIIASHVSFRSVHSKVCACPRR